jgi:hypothetical protein
MNPTNQLLSQLFNDPKTGFVGAEKLLKRAKLQNPKITLNQVKEFLKLNEVHQVFQKPKTTKIVPRIHESQYLTSMNTNRWIDYIDDFIQNYNSSYHSSIKRIPERLEIFD